MNVRTYVTGPDGERGIWFFTLEADRLAAVLGARLMYGLPYRWAAMRVLPERDRVTYSSERHIPFAPGHCRLEARIGRLVTASDFERFSHGPVPALHVASWPPDSCATGTCTLASAYG